MTTQASTTHGIQRGDTVRVLAGNDRGKLGKVLRVLPRASRVIVEGVAVVTRHTKATAKLPHGGRVQVPAAIDLSNVGLICPSCAKPTSVKMSLTKSGREALCRVCQASLERKATR